MTTSRRSFFSIVVAGSATLVAAAKAAGAATTADNPIVYDFGGDPLSKRWVHSTGLNANHTHAFSYDGYPPDHTHNFASYRGPDREDPLLRNCRCVLLDEEGQA